MWERATRTVLMISGPDLNKKQKCGKSVGLVDLYPTILDLAGLPANPSNEGHSLKPLIDNPDADQPYAAVTTYGRNNHAVRTEFFRYIHYEDNSEELYDHRIDENEWINLANMTGFAKEKEKLQKFLPRINAPWARTSKYDVNDYFIQQRKEQLAE